MLLHGYPQNHTLWYLVAQELEAQGVLDEWDVLIPDLPGYINRFSGWVLWPWYWAHSFFPLNLDWKGMDSLQRPHPRTAPI